DHGLVEQDCLQRTIRCGQIPVPRVSFEVPRFRAKPFGEEYLRLRYMIAKYDSAKTANVSVSQFRLIIECEFKVAVAVAFCVSRHNSELPRHAQMGEKAAPFDEFQDDPFPAATSAIEHAARNALAPF